MRHLLFGTRLGFDDTHGNPVLRAAVHGLAAVSNRTMIDCVEAAADYLERTEASDAAGLEWIAARHQSEDRRLNRDARRLFDRWLSDRSDRALSHAH